MGRKKASSSVTKKEAEQLSINEQLVQAALLAQELQRRSTAVTPQTMVGLRNVSDLTIGIPGAFGQGDVHLHAAFRNEDPATYTIIPFAWWREIRSGKYVDQGMLMRDDSIIGEGYTPAPPDRPQDLAPNFSVNLVIDPQQWIDSRNEIQIREDIMKMTSLNSLRRLRRAVDMKLRSIVDSIPDQYRDTTKASNGYVPPKGWDKRHKMALEQLPAIYRLVDDLTSRRIEGAD